MPLTHPDPARTDPVPPSLSRTDPKLTTFSPVSPYRDRIEQGSGGRNFLVGIAVLLCLVAAAGIVLLFPDLTTSEPRRTAQAPRAIAPPMPTPTAVSTPAPILAPAPMQKVEQPRGFDVHPLDQPAPMTNVPPPIATVPPPLAAARPVPPPSGGEQKLVVPSPKPRRTVSNSLAPVHLHPPTVSGPQSATAEPRSEPGEAPPIDAGDLPPPERGMETPRQ